MTIKELRDMHPPPHPIEEAKAVMILAIDNIRKNLANLLMTIGMCHRICGLNEDSPEFTITHTYAIYVLVVFQNNFFLVS